MKKKPAVTIPVRLELEYILDQRRIRQGLDGGATVNESKLRLRLRHIATTVAQQKAVEVAASIGRPVRPVSQGTINAWVDQEVKATLGTARQDAARKPDLMQWMQELAKVNADQWDRRASTAILGLNVGIIEEVAISGGSSHYRWLTEQDSRVRDWHADLEGTIQNWDDPPMGGGSHKEDAGHPGSGYGCRCLPEPLPVTMTERRAQRVEPKPELAKPVAKVSKKKRLRPSKEITSQKYEGPLKPNMTLSEAENAIKWLPEEHGITWDKDGAVIHRQRGTERKMHMSNEEWHHVLKHPGHTWTHNHPNGNPSLSASDITFSMVADSSVARAITESRGGMTLTVTDATKWKAAAANPIVKYKLQSIEESCNDAAKREMAEFLTGPVFEKSRQWDVYLDGFASEAVRLYNKIGAKYGFRVERF